MTTAEHSEHSPQLASPEQLRTLMEDAEALLSTGTLSCDYRFRHETALGSICFSFVESLDEEGASFSSADISIQAPATATGPVRELASFSFQEFEETYSNQRLDDLETRIIVERARDICVDVLAKGEAIDDAEKAILLFLLREHAMLLDGIPNLMPCAVGDSWEAMPVLSAIREFTRSHKDQITESASYSHRRDDGDFVSVAYTRHMSGDGEPQTVQTEIEFRDAKRDLYHHVSCVDERFEEAFALTLDGNGNPVTPEGLEGKPYASDIEYIHEVIAAERKDKAKPRKLQGVTSEIIRLYNKEDDHELQDLCAVADNAWRDFRFSPRGSVAETNAILEYNRSFAELKAKFIQKHDLRLQNDILPETIQDKAGLDAYLEENFSVIKIKNEEIKTTSVLYGDAELARTNARNIEFFFANIFGVTFQNPTEDIGYVGGVSLYGFFRITYKDYPPLLVKGFILLRELAIFEE